MTRHLLAYAWCLAAGVTVLAGAQTPPPTQSPTFRAGIDVVQLDVSVLDKNRRPVRGLTAADFIVLEDGKLQPVVAFQAVDIPDRVIPATPWMREVAPDVATNGVFSGRLVVVVIDGMPGRDYWTAGTASRVADQILDQLGPDDLTAVVYTAFNEKAQGFTSDRARIREALTDISRLTPPRLNTKVKCLAPGARTLEELLRVSETLQAEPQRRKTILFVSSGFQVFDMGHLPNDCVAEELKELLRESQRSNINIYAIDPGRLMAGWGMGSGRVAPPVRLDARLAGSEGLRMLAERTGGRAVINDEKDHPESEVPAIFEENGSYYLLGFQSTNSRVDGKFRTLEVKVNRPGVEVRTRNGYFAGTPKAKTSKKRALSPLEESLLGLLPTTETPLRATAAPFAMPGKPGAVVAIALSVRLPVSFERPTEHLDVLANAFDLEGQSQAFERQALDLKVASDASGESEYEVLSRLALPPGRYELRIGTETGARQRGSVYTFVDVPNFAKDDLSLSGLVLDKRSLTRSVASEEALKDLVPVLPTAARAFRATDVVTSFLRVYQSSSRPTPVSVAARVVNDRNETVFEQKTPIGPERFGVNRSADFQLDVPLARLAPGEYLLTIDATLGKHEAKREVRFTVK